MSDRPSSYFVTPLDRVSLNADKTVRFKGVDYEPDEHTAYAVIRCGFAFPAINWYGDTVHPRVLGKSFATLKHKPVNLQHSMKHLGANRDRVVGGVLDTDFPNLSGRSWNAENSVDVHGQAVISLWKKTEGMDRVLGKHLGGRHEYAVSQEVFYNGDDSGFIIDATDDERLSTTPDDLWKCGWNYIPVRAADKALLATRDWKEGRMVDRADGGGYVGRWKGRKAHLLLNGLEEPVFYGGVAVVEYGAERGAGIDVLMASINGEDAASRAAMDGLRRAMRDLENAVSGIIQQKD